MYDSSEDSFSQSHVADLVLSENILIFVIWWQPSPFWHPNILIIFPVWNIIVPGQARGYELHKLESYFIHLAQKYWLPLYYVKYAFMNIQQKTTCLLDLT